MINRSLIRIKTVQILYSYLLSRNDFKLALPPDAQNSSKEQLLAYDVYCDMLGLLLKLTSTPMGPGTGVVMDEDPVLKKNKVGSALRDNASIKEFVSGRKERIAALDQIVGALRNSIAESTVYNDYKRRRKLTLKDDVDFWNTVFTTTVRKSKILERYMRGFGDFSHGALERGVQMFTETLSGYDNTRTTYLKACADLQTSMRQAYNLYHALLWLPVEITRIQAARLDAAKHKYLPTAEELNPDMRFVDNAFVKALSCSKEMEEYITEYPEADPSSWKDGDLLCNKLLDSILASDLYKDYMASESTDYGKDASFWREVIRTIIVPSDILSEVMEDRNVYWNDDLEIMSTYVLKTIRRSYLDNEGNALAEPELKLLPMYMNGDDERFGAELFEFVVNNRVAYRAYIDKFINTEHWDTDRLALMDIVILQTAIAELINYPSIPIAVTLNEYIEIANAYSTPRSGQFVNGILYSVIGQLREEGVITK